MIDHRNETLGLVEKEEESGEGEEEGDDDIDAFIVPDEGGDKKGYGGAGEQGGGASEAGQSEGELNQEDESVVRKSDFVMYLDYMLRTLQDPGVRAAATEEGELRDAVKHCEETLTSRRTQMVESSAWRPDFKSALDTRPILKCHDTSHRKDCEACGRTNHPSTNVMSFSGERYQPKDVWIFDLAAHQHTSSRDDEEDNEKTEFLVGRFCYARAIVYHALHHYKWRLQRKLREALDEIKGAKKGEAAIDSVLEKPEFVERLHGNINCLVQLTEQFAETSQAERLQSSSQAKSRNLVTVEDVGGEDRVFELVEELEEGAIDV